MTSDIQILNDKLTSCCKLSDLCRLCGSYNSNMMPIFDKKHKFDYSKIINTHFPDFHVEECDQLPLSMCSHCIAALTAWHEFYTSCIDVNSKFQTIIEKVRDFKTILKKDMPMPIMFRAINKNMDQLNNQLNSKEMIPVVQRVVEDDQVDKCDVEVVEIGIEDITSYTDEEYKSSIVIDNDEVSNAGSCDNNDERSLGENTEDEVEETKHNIELLETNETNENPIEFHECIPEKERTVGKVLRKYEKTVKLKKSTVCRICGKLYSSRTTYLHHLQKFHSTHMKSRRNPAKKKEDVPEVCYYCGKIFRTKASYRSHIRCQHSDVPRKPKPKKRPRRMCELCGKICHGSSFNSHMKKHADPSRVTCQICNKIFSHESSLRNHIRVRHSNERPYACELCPSSFKRPDYLRSHMRYKHEEKTHSEGGVASDAIFRCDYCGYRYKTLENYRKHMKGNSEGNKSGCNNSFHCALCGEVFKKRNYLLLHKKYVHDEKQPYHISGDAIGPFKCDKCDRRFASITGRNYHCQKAHGCLYDSKINKKCEHCGLVFSNRVFFAKHQAKLQLQPTCYLCWKKFSDKETLANHMNNDHGNDLPFVCELCQCRFVRLRQLNSHMRARHLEIKPFVCESCPYRTARKDSLDMHVRSCHLGEKPHKCSICGRGFSQRGDCRKHEVIHSKTK